MTGTSPPQMIGKRRRSLTHKPAHQKTVTRSGREITRYDYKRLHAGAAAALPDPKTYEEAMSRPDADK